MSILIGTVRAHTQRVRRISGAERWSVEKIMEVERVEDEGEKAARDGGRRRRGTKGVERH